MSGKVTSLQFQKRTAERVNVYLDGRFAFGLPAVAAAELRLGQYLTDADIERLQTLDSEQKAYDRAVRFLSYRPRSQAEVRLYLQKAGSDEGLIEAVIGQLAAQGYLNDAEFARFWVEGRQQFRPRSAYALRQELRRKGLDDSVIDGAVSGRDQAVDAYNAGRTRAWRLADLARHDPMVFRRKLSDFLLRRGFDYDVISDVVNRLLGEVVDEEQ